MLRRFCLTSAFAGLTAAAAFAQWTSDPATNTPVCTGEGNASTPVIAADGKGGSIMSWLDYRNGNSDIYAQRMRETGQPAWAVNGIPICSLPHIQNSPVIASDGKGGAFIAWVDYRTNDTADIYIQRVDSTGAPLWTLNGVPVCTASGQQTAPDIVPDGFGGAIVAWIDQRNGTPTDVYMQRIAANGAMMWTADGVPVCMAAGDQFSPVLASDRTGGVYVVWADWRNGNSDIYAQRVNAAGHPAWSADGLPVCTAAASQLYAVAVPDTSGGAIVAWTDWRGGTFSDIYAQRMDSAGSMLWSVDGVVVTAGYNDQIDEAACPDGAGGIIVAWQDFRNSQAADVFAQRLSGSGSPLWATNGVSVCSAAGLQENIVVTDDGVGGAVIAWDDYRSTTGFDIYGEHINGLGTSLWPADGIPICIAAGDQILPCVLADGASGAVFAWFDQRGPDGDIYAQREFLEDSLPVRLASFSCTEISGGGVRIEWRTLSETGTYGFTVQRRIDGQTTWDTLAGSFRPGAGTTAEPRDYEFVDGSPPAGKLWYRLEEIDLDGSRTYFDPVSVAPATGITNGRNEVPGDRLEVYPNPFNPGTVISWQVSVGGDVKLAIFDLLGREVMTLVDRIQAPGTYQVRLNARDLTSGTYFCRLSTRGGVSSRRIILLR